MFNETDKESKIVESANLQQFLVDITNKVLSAQSPLLYIEREHQGTKEYENVFRLLDDVLKEISAMEDQGLDKLNKDNLLRLNKRADEAIIQFEKFYGNKQAKITAKPN